MRRKRTGADELLEQFDHYRLAGNFSERRFVIFGHERRRFLAVSFLCSYWNRGVHGSGRVFRVRDDYLDNLS
jgi:hypothetical protein